jgi:hypothetical protein
MIRISISQAAFDAVASTLPLGSVGYENEVNERGERLIWLDHAVVSRLRAMRGRGESYSDVILKLVAHAGDADAGSETGRIALTAQLLNTIGRCELTRSEGRPWGFWSSSRLL